MASLWGELKRRNVVRVAVAYVIVAWLILQLADVLISLLILPEWVGRPIFLLLLIGFPLALFFAWAYELTPEGLKKEKDVDRTKSLTHITGRKLDFVIIGVLLVALAVFAVERFVLLPDRAPITDASQDFLATEVQRSIAVLPFVNLSPDPDQEYFSDGLSEEILTLLAKIPELKVIGRTSSFAFKGKNEDLRVIGQTLGVTTVLEGSVRKSGERVRVTAQLNDVSDGSHIWSETYERTMTDVFAIQDDVAAAIIDALEIHVGAKSIRGRPTNNTEAYALYFQARVSVNAKDPENAEKMLLKAVELDPNFAEAYELLAFSYYEQSGWHLPAAEGSKLMGEAAAKAIAIDPDLAFAQALLESASNSSGLREIQGFQRALLKEPGKTEVYEALVWKLQQVGYFREALRVAERFVERDPLLPAANYWLANALCALGRFDEAVAAWELAAQLGHVMSMDYIVAANLMEKHDESAIAIREELLRQAGYSETTWVRELVTGARDPTSGQAYLDRRIAQIVASAPAEDASDLEFELNFDYLIFGHLDRYFEIIIDTALDSTWGDAELYVWTGTIHRQTGFTAHPKYLEVAESLGMIELWEQRGPPDFCEKVDDEWVCE